MRTDEPVNPETGMAPGYDFAVELIRSLSKPYYGYPPRLSDEEQREVEDILDVIIKRYGAEYFGKRCRGWTQEGIPCRATLFSGRSRSAELEWCFRHRDQRPRD